MRKVRIMEAKYTENIHVYKAALLPKVKVIVRIEDVGEVANAMMSDIFVAAKAAIEFNESCMEQAVKEVKKSEK